MKKKVIIIAAGEHGYVVRSMVEALPHLAFAGFLDDTKTGNEIVGTVADSQSFIDTGHVFFVAIGTNAVRERVFRDLESHGAEFVSLVHPSALVEASVTIGKGVMIGARSYVNVNARISDGAIINNCCLVEHDNEIGAFAHLAPGVVTGGGVSVGGQTFVGLGAIINDHVRIGSEVTIGSGSVVTEDIAEHLTAVGAPARIITKNV